MRGVFGAKASNVPTLSVLFPERPKLTTKGFAPDKNATDWPLYPLSEPNVCI